MHVLPHSRVLSIPVVQAVAQHGVVVGCCWSSCGGSGWCVVGEGVTFSKGWDIDLGIWGDNCI